MSNNPNPELDFKNSNNPTKEILASYDIYNEIILSNNNLPYALDLSSSPYPNTRINTTTTTTSTTVSPNLFNSGVFNLLSSGNYFVDDMSIFNNYIHYDTKSDIKVFNPQNLLEQSIIAFNVYSLEYR